MTIDKEEEEY